MALKISVIVCAHNEARYLSACLHSLLAQSRLPDEILVINNASTDETRAVALRVPSVQVVDEPRERARRCSRDRTPRGRWQLFRNGARTV